MPNQCPKFKFGEDDTIHRRDGSPPIPGDEPVFLLRGKDEVAPLAIRAYIDIMESFPESRLAMEHAESARDMLNRILKFQEENPERVGMGCHTCEHLTSRERLPLGRLK